MQRRLVKFIPKTLVGSTFRMVRRIRFLIYRADSLLHKKQMNVFCPCCNTSFRNFNESNFLLLPKQFNTSRYLQTRQDVLCPICRSMPRHRILAIWSSEHLSLLKEKRILYFAPEYGMMRWMKRNGIAVTTADLNSSADMELDIQDTNLPDASYDVVCCNHVLEHVDNFRKAILELYRILMPGGMLICSFPMDPKIELLDEEEKPLTEEERLNRFGQRDHKRVFGMKADIFLKEVGFDVEVINGEDYPDNIVPVVGPADYDMNRLFQCKKPTME